MALSILDVVLKHRESVHIAGAVPIGLLAPIVHQPHPGDDREQAFVIAGADDGRSLVWRTGAPTAGEGGPTVFVVRPLTSAQWRALLDEAVSVRQLLAADGDAARIVLARDLDGGGGVTVEPTTISAEVTAAQLPDETGTDQDGNRRPNRPAWLGRVKGALLSPDREDHAAEIAVALESASSASSSRATTSEDGDTVATTGLHVVRTRQNGTVEVRRFRRQIDAMIAVERAALR